MIKGHDFKTILSVLVLAVSFSACSDFGLDSDNEGNEPAAASFTIDVLPALQANCGSCHSFANPSGGLDLSSYSALMAGGNSGLSVLAENSAGSLLIERLVTTDTNSRMPLFGSPLDQADISIIEEWIDDGALDN